ncbi:selenoprotein N isoform X2 [Procambarus clarkii]|uniref:selenoprotein N isoform X2 n=1 Tax=Procambarus clarkii TaxID=6728 RepID=UPI001E67265C|nr:selenoprotein N-like isoform X2 [Procambarus clarkii]
MTKLRKRISGADFIKCGSRVTPDGGRTAIPQDNVNWRAAVPQDSDGGITAISQDNVDWRAAVPQDSDGGRTAISQDNVDWRAAVPQDSDGGRTAISQDNVDRRAAVPQDSDGGRTAISQDNVDRRAAVPQDSDGGRTAISQDNVDWRAAVPQDSDGGRTAISQDNVDYHHREKDPRKVNQNGQHHKGKILWVIILGISITSLLCIWSSVEDASRPIWMPDTTRGADLVTVHTNFTPLNPSAFITFLDSEESRRSLHGVLSWKVASVSWSWIPCKAFAVLLPEKASAKVPGHVWRLLPDITPNKFMFRYVPPPPSGHVEEFLFQLLSLFHPQPFLLSRYGPRGAAAVVRARNIDCLDIWFRLHAEYQLNTPPRLPLWFTPAAFIGRLIINTTDLNVKLFSMHVPKHRPLNVDLEWLIGPREEEDMEVTITHMEEMSITSGDAVVPDSITWMQEINAQEALTMLEKELYKFMKVDYHNFTEAYVRASSESRPVHSVVLWGVLDDQSC